MEINLGNKFGGNMGVGLETADVGNVGHAAAEASGASRTPANLTIGEGFADISSSEPVARVPESALRRNDDLGNLVNSAFNLPPPPMPTFSE